MQRRSSDDQITRSTNRRDALRWLVSGGVGLVVGCSGREQSDGESQTSSPRRDVPLRVALVGTDAESEAMRLSWSMTMEQPLDIQILPPLRSGSGATAEIANKVANVDVAVFPQYALGQIVRSDATVRFNDTTLESYDEQFGPQPPAVQNGLGAFGGKTYGVPLGAKLFSVLSIDSEPSLKSWDEYHQWVQQLGGKVAEPMSEGWAASSFLNRCASTLSRGWLFNRKTMKSELIQDGYVAVLDQFAKTAKLYASEPLGPSDIWKRLREGTLRGGVGFEVPHQTSDNDAESSEQFEVAVTNCPLESEVDRLYFDVSMPLAAVSQGCRQTDAAKQFIGWLAAGETSNNLRRTLPLGSKTRQRSDESGSQPTPYAKWLSQRLETRRIVPPMALPGADRYFLALDRRVRECLSGASKASDALRAAHDDWESITDGLGRDQQGVDWRKGMGFGA